MGVNEDEMPICKNDISAESGYKVKTLPWSTLPLKICQLDTPLEVSRFPLNKSNTANFSI